MAGWLRLDSSRDRGVMRPRVLAAAALALAVLAAACATSGRLAPGPSEGVRFEYVDRLARQVTVAGTFNDWSTSAHPMTRTRSAGTWSIVVYLDPGEHAFMFVVDGRWVVPAAAEAFVDDGFGSKNAVVVVPPRGR